MKRQGWMVAWIQDELVILSQLPIPLTKGKGKIQHGHTKTFSYQDFFFAKMNSKFKTNLKELYRCKIG